MTSLEKEPEVLIALSTCPAAAADTIATALVTERLAACVNQVPGVRSIYMWQGQLQTDAEVLLIIKTTAARFAVLKERFGSLHPYELPELVAIPVCAGSEQFFDWVRHTVAPI